MPCIAYGGALTAALLLSRYVSLSLGRFHCGTGRPASLALIVYFTKPMLQSFPLFTVARRIRQTIANFMFPVSEALAVLPALPIVAPVPQRLRRNSRDLWDRDLNVGLPWRSLSG